MRWILLPLLLAACTNPQRERPTRTGDTIGTATMLPDGTLRMTMRSVECDGMVAHGTFDVRPSESRYASVLKPLEPIRPGDSKPVKAGETPPCPKF